MLELSAEERDGLAEALRATRERRHWVRLRAVWLAAEGRSVPEIAADLGAGASSVFAWLAHWRCTPDPAALADAPKSGRPRTLNTPLCAELTALLDLPPELYGYQATGWTVAVLERHFARRVVFGALNPFAGTRLCMTAGRNGGPEFREYLRLLRARYKRWDLLLVLDRGSCHTAKATLALAAALRITFAWLPTACPELNPVEALWRDGKQHVSANRAHADLDAHATDFAAHVGGHDARTALRLSGVSSGNFWLTT